MEKPELKKRFGYHALKEDHPEKYALILEMAKLFAELVDEVCPDSREAALAHTKIEEAVMWANTAIARKS